jgi:hypothetical protein
MKTRTLLNVVLVAIVVGLALVVYFHPGAKAAKPKVTLTNFKPAAVKTIRIAQPDQPTVKLVRRHNNWRMIAPVKAPADSARITTLLGDLDEASAVQYPAAKKKLSKYGLKPPKLTLWINGKTLLFGATDPLHHRRYIKVGDTIHLVNDSLYYRLTGDPMQFAGKQLLPKNAAITAIELPSQTIRLGKNGEWQLTPKNAKIPADTIQKLVDAWKNARAIGVSQWKPKKKQKTKGEVAIDLKHRKAPLRFAILDKQSSFTLARPDLKLKYKMSASQRKDLLKLKPKAKTKPKIAPSSEKASGKPNSGA